MWTRTADGRFIEATDHQLRAELARRHIDGVVSIADVIKAATDTEVVEEILRRDAQVFAAVLSDAKLRAECNRRWGEDDCPMAKTLRHERDEATARSKSLETALDAGPFTYLEALKGLKPDFEVPEYDAECRRYIEGVTRDMEASGVGLMKWLPTFLSGDAKALIESGPGIARLPEPRSEPLAFLDEDLLCDDE